MNPKPSHPVPPPLALFLPQTVSKQHAGPSIRPVPVRVVYAPLPVDGLFDTAFPGAALVQYSGGYARCTIA